MLSWVQTYIPVYDYICRNSFEEHLEKIAVEELPNGEAIKASRLLVSLFAAAESINYKYVLLLSIYTCGL